MLASASNGERAFRKGYIDGVAAVLLSYGLTEVEIETCLWMRRLDKWKRGGRLYPMAYKIPPLEPKKEERQQLKFYMVRVLMNESTRELRAPNDL